MRRCTAEHGSVTDWWFPASSPWGLGGGLVSYSSSLLSAAVIRYHDQKELREERACFFFQCVVRGSKSWESISLTANRKQKEQTKLGGDMNSQHPSLVMYFLQQSCTHSRFYNLPRQRLHLGTKCSDTRTYGGRFYSVHHSANQVVYYLCFREFAYHRTLASFLRSSCVTLAWMTSVGQSFGIRCRTLVQMASYKVYLV